MGDEIVRTRSQSSQSRTRLKYEVMSHYSGGKPACSCCGETAPEFLVVDHVEGGGTQHREQIGGGGARICQWLKKNGYPSGYRVLCANCNQSFACWGYCPHQSKSRLLISPTVGEISRNVVLAAARKLHAEGVYPSLGKVAAEAGVDRRTVIKHRRRLMVNKMWPVGDLSRGGRPSVLLRQKVAAC